MIARAIGLLFIAGCAIDRPGNAPPFDHIADEGKHPEIYNGVETWRAGRVGATGSAGATGAVGATGARGATGGTAPTGAVGATGATGAVGATGARGATGATGGDGTNGTAGTLAPSGMLYGAPEYFTAGPSGDQVAATELTAYFNIASTGSTNGSVKLPLGDPVGTFRVLVNITGVTLKFYPGVGDTIANAAVVNATSLSKLTCMKKTSTRWVTF